MQGAFVKPRHTDSPFQTKRFGNFQLTDAVRPGPGVAVVPREGYRAAVYRDRKNGFVIPLLSASVSSEHLFDVFLALLEPLGEVVDVILETSHRCKSGEHRDLRRRGIDRPILASYCCEFEDLLLNDGCCGIAVMSPTLPMEVQFDEHKLLTIYAQDLRPFRRILKSFGIPRDDAMKLISEGEHVHASDPEYYAEFQKLCRRLGIGRVSRVR
jgi:hypothetical protein